MIFKYISPILLVYFLLLSWACKMPTGEDQGLTATKDPTISFNQILIADSITHWWAHCPVEITNDGIVDIVFINNNSTGGYLGYCEGRTDGRKWEKKVIATQPPGGGLFASGDLECQDLDGDGDIDVLGIKHPGEWKDAGASAEIFWYENPNWEVHRVGTVPDAVKDVNFGDFDNDGKMDLCILTFDENTLSIFRQLHPDEWALVQFLQGYQNFHEGMAIGDVDGDGDLDIGANGLILYNPGTDLTKEWLIDIIDHQWNSQEGDWSRNATKMYMKDLDGDKKQEVFVSHSERSGYPLIYNQRTDDGKWSTSIIKDSIPACHTLQVFDFNNDGHFDVLAGVNKGRAINLDKIEFPVYIFLGGPDYKKWTEHIITNDGIYNGQATDYDGDGDIDFIRYPSHEATKIYLYENKT